ncbi:hypothetical protein F53441_12159 [Fusarium austroafricanum]|uniref:Uncharacterized protein n=1 Tax=Fusarium austroafricanum TaxID=2364996 RepID=A0A8H4NMT3_9HYPO|nr:hypothetical protein F53441_12159 [Fusarium austroafricanum]
MSLSSILLGQLPSTLYLLNGDQASDLNFTAYDSYAKSQQGLFKELSSPAINPHDTELLGKVADHLRQHGQRDEALTYVSTLSRNADSVACQTTLDLVTRLILMVEVGCLEKSSGFMYQTGPRTAPLWTKDSLTDLTTKLFPISSYQGYSGLSITPGFDAWSLENVAGIRIEFTDNLADHLRLTNNNTQLYIFHHVAYLEKQRYE